jgi:hypothetical protein
MLKAELWNKSVPRVELDQRARDARLRLERIGRQLVPRAASIIANESTVRSKSCLADSNNRIRAGMIASESPERAKPPKHYSQRNHQSASHQFRTRLRATNRRANRVCCE